MNMNRMFAMISSSVGERGPHCKKNPQKKKQHCLAVDAGLDRWGLLMSCKRKANMYEIISGDMKNHAERI